MFDPDDIDAPDIFGDLGRDAMKVVGPLALLLFAPGSCSSPRSAACRTSIATSAAPSTWAAYGVDGDGDGIADLRLGIPE